MLLTPSYPREEKGIQTEEIELNVAVFCTKIFFSACSPMDNVGNSGGIEGLSEVLIVSSS